MKVPTYQVGQKYRCPRCDAEIVVGEPAPKASEAVDGQASASVPPADDETLHLHRPGTSVDSDEFAISCQVCRSRLPVHPTQIGTTIKCPDCYSSVTVKAPPKRIQSKQAPTGTWDDADSLAGGPTAMEVSAQKQLEKAKAAQEQEEAEERESSSERFTEGLFAFFADRHAVGRMVILAIWFELAVTLFHYVREMRISEDTPATQGEATSLVAALAMGFIFLTFLHAAAACGLALVKDTSDGLRRIEHWPGFNPLAWGRDVFYIVNAGIFAALPGVVLGIVLGLVGFSGLVLFTAAASFGGMFPPMLLSMFQSNSAKAPFSKEVWNDIGRRQDPWKLNYLITSLVIIAGLFAIVFCLASGFFLGLALATGLVALIMIYFRTIGRLFGILAGRDVEPAAGS
ncbi:MAG: hypothetical protein H8E44_15945 [Planctomycetes bacterium]|nr:hypothetical protein [Planctomycetota bacterium]